MSTWKKRERSFSVVPPICHGCRHAGKDAKTWGQKFLKKGKDFRSPSALTWITVLVENLFALEMYPLFSVLMFPLVLLQDSHGLNHDFYAFISIVNWCPFFFHSFHETNIIVFFQYLIVIYLLCIINILIRPSA